MTISIAHLNGNPASATDLAPLAFAGFAHFTALQASKRSGVLDCELVGDRVILGGHCVTVIEGHFQI